MTNTKFFNTSKLPYGTTGILVPVGINTSDRTKSFDIHVYNTNGTNSSTVVFYIKEGPNSSFDPIDLAAPGAFYLYEQTVASENIGPLKSFNLKDFKIPANYGLYADFGSGIFTVLSTSE